MVVLVRCSKCRAQLQAPQGTTSIWCSYCHTVTVTTTTHARSQPAPPRHTAPLRAPRKKAVICGVNYLDSESELGGCTNDAKAMKQFLISRFKFPASNILTLTEEEERDPNMLPTKRNIRRALAWLVEGVGAGDSLVFYFSGHGEQIRDQDGDEEDGRDEYLLPMDFEDEGKISDDVINNTIVKPIPAGARLTAIFDCCSSGTMLDLPFLCTVERNNKYEWEDHRPKNRVWKGTSGGEAIAISGCEDHDFSHETVLLKKRNGAMTHCLMEAIKKGQATTYGSLLTNMKIAIHKLTTEDEDGNIVPITQIPQLSANTRFNIFAKPFTL